MSFERTKNSIENLSSRESITLDLLFDMMVCVSQDVMRYNNANDLSDTPTEDNPLLLKKVYNLMQMTLSAYEKNKDGMADFGSAMQEKYAKLVEQLNNLLLELTETKADLEKAEAKDEELKRKQAELQETRGHLLSVGEECEELQRKIDILSDSALDEKAKEKESLEENLKQRKAEFAALDKDKQDLQEEIDGLNEQKQNLKNSIENLQNEKESLSNEEDLLLQEKNGMEKALENLRLKLKEYEKWIEEYPEMNKSIQEKHDEEKAKITVMINAFSSVISEDFLRESLFNTDSANENFSLEEHPDYNVVKTNIGNITELQAWFNDMENRINGLINIYGKMLQTVVNQSDKLTKESN